MKAYTRSMTEGNELKHIVLFTLPLLLGNLFQQVYNIADSAIVGQFLGAQALAAVGATGSMTFFFYTLCNGMSVGAGVLIAQAFGAGDNERVKRFIVNSAYALGGIGLIITVLSVILCRPLLVMLGTPESILDNSVSYMSVACMGTFAVAAYNWINSVLRSLGDSKTPLYFLIIASILNVLLDLLFVPVFNMGVAGAALATIIAQGLSAVLSILFAIKHNFYFGIPKDMLKPDKDMIKLCVKTGVPLALQNAMVSVSMIYLQRTANTFGDTVIAAYTVTMRVEQLIHQPFMSLGAAMATFAGQNKGACKIDRVKKGYHKALLLSSGFAVLMAVVFFFCGGFIARLFVKEAEVIEIAAKALLLSSCFYVPLGFIHTTRGL